MKKVLIHVGFVFGISATSLIGMAGIVDGGGGAAVVAFLMFAMAWILADAYRCHLRVAQQPPADRVKAANSLPDLSALHVNPAKKAEGFFWLTDEPTTTIDPEIEKRYRQSIKSRVATTGPLPDVFDLSEMD